MISLPVLRSCLFCEEFLLASWNTIFKFLNTDRTLTGKYSKSDSQSGHRLGLSVLKVGALGFQSSHNESHFFLSCAMCAQIMLSNSGSPAKPLIAWITRSFRSPVRMPLRPCKDPKSVCLAGLEGAMRATCPIHLACRLPIKILQSGTPNLRAHSSFVIRSSRIFTQEMPSTSRIFPYQKLFSFLLVMELRGQFSQPYRRTVDT